jgi:hypothetical protein
VLFYLAIWPLIAGSLFLWGTVLLRATGAVTAPAKDNPSDWERPGDIGFAALWVGFAVMGALLPLAALLVPLSPAIATLALLLVAFSLLVPAIREIALRIIRAMLATPGNATVFAGHVVAVATVAYLASRQVIYFDTAVYHLPLARFLAESGAVKGLVTLFVNYGQTSSWFAIAAPGTAGGEFGWGSTTANFLIAALAAAHAASSLWRIARDNGAPADFVAGFGYPLVLIMAARWGMPASLSPDLPVMLLCVTVAWAVSLGHCRLAVLTALLTAGFAIGIKLSAIPLGAVAVLAALASARIHGLLFVAVCYLLAAALILPTLALGVLSSGCLAFPVAASCFDLPWTPDASALVGYTKLILEAARGGGNSLPPDTAFSEQFLIWLFRDRSGAVTVLGGLVLLFMMLGYLVRLRWTGQDLKSFPVWALTLGGAGMIYVAATAPTGRFIGGYTAVLAAVSLCAFPCLLPPLRRFVRLGILPAMLIAAAIGIDYTSPGAAVRFALSGQIAAEAYPDPGNGWLFPKRIIPFDIHNPKVPLVRKIETSTNGFVAVRVAPRTGECWAVSPPCSVVGVGENVRYLEPDRGFEGGFMWRRAAEKRD